MPNSSPANETTTIFKHDNFFHPVPLSEAKLVDPGLVLSSSSSSPCNDNADQYKFKITATTGVAVWVWLDYPAGLIGRFDENAFFLRKGEEKDIEFKFHDDEEGGKVWRWQKKVMVRSLWDNYLP